MAAVARLKRRPEFLRVAGGRQKWVAPGLILQALRQDDSKPSTEGIAPARVGFTASAKVGNAVVRNRARRRLRAAAASVLPLPCGAGARLCVDRPRRHLEAPVRRSGGRSRGRAQAFGIVSRGCRRPWPPRRNRRTAMRLERALCIGLIRVYQYGISPLLPRVCRYGPSCSEYAREAIERHGVILGCWLAAAAAAAVPSLGRPRLRSGARARPVDVAAIDQSALNRAGRARSARMGRR